MSVDTYQAGFRKMEIFGNKALFSNSRIAETTIPAGLIAYELRENDNKADYNEHGEPLPPLLSIAKSVLIDHFGTVLVREKFEIVELGEILLGENDWSFGDEEMSLDKAMARL